MSPESDTSAEEEVPKKTKTKANKEVDNEEGERYSGGPIPEVSLPDQSED